MHFAFYLEDKNLGDKRISIFELEHYLESNDGRLPDNILLSDLARLYLVYKTIPFLTKIRGDKEIYPFDERKNQTPSNWQEAIACYMEDHENENHGPKEFRFNLLSERGQAAFDAFLHPTDDVM